MAIARPLVLTGSEPGSRPRMGSGPVDAVNALTLDDPYLAEFLRGGHDAASGVRVSTDSALRNPTMFRAVSLISYAIGMLPLQLIDDTTKQKVSDHSAYRLLHREPNNYQTAFDYKSLMQARALVHGDSYARIIRSRDLRTGRAKVVRTVPFDVGTIEPVLTPDWNVLYRYSAPTGGVQMLPASDVFHLRGLSMNGLTGLSMVKQARDAIGLALAQELAAGRLFKNGAMIGGALKSPGPLSDTAFDRLQKSIAEREGADNAGKTLLLEEGLEWTGFGQTPRDSQMIELRRFQVEEISRASGVPRPLLMMDDTSWGSGISELGRFFVTYALNPWFTAWEQAAERSFLAEEEKGQLSFKFNAGALLRGSMKDQAEWFSKALGSGGGRAWGTQNEIRDILDWPADANPMSDELGMGAMAAPAKQAAA